MLRKIPEQGNLRVYILWENARVYNREENNHGAEVSQRSLKSSPKMKNICIKKMFIGHLIRIKEKYLHVLLTSN